MGPVVSTNDSVHMPPPWSLEGPSHPEEEGRLTFVQAINSFLYAWAQNYVLMLVDRRGLSSCLQKRTSTHCLDCLLPCPFMRTMSKLPTLQEKDKRWNVRGLLIRILNILLFVEIDVKLNHGNSCFQPITALLIGDPMVCGYLTAQMILTVLKCDYVTQVHGRLPTVQ